MKNADIKQLALLCELVDTQSLTAAALRVALSPSAASQSLTRLREALGDEIVVRQGPHYRLTPYGELAVDRFRQVLGIWQQTSEQGVPFNPANCAERLAVACSEAVSIIDPADLYVRIAGTAPAMLLDLQSAQNGMADVLALRAAQVDVVCSHLPPPADAGDLHSIKLGEWRATVCCLSVQHPRIGRSLSLDQYLTEIHLVTLYGTRRESLASPLSQEIEARGRQRRTSLVHSVRVAADILSRTDRLVTCNEEQARMIMRMAPGVHALPLPAELDLPSLDLYMVWHQRTHHSALHRWLREQIRDLWQSAGVDRLA